MKKSLGEVIAATRKLRGMTQAELAEKMNITDKAVSKWERGLSCPDISSLPRLSEVLGVSVDELMQVNESDNKVNIKPTTVKKILCGALVALIGLAFSIVFLVYAMKHPWSYNDIEGLLGSLLGTKMFIPLIISLITMFSGVIYSFLCAYKESY